MNTASQHDARFVPRRAPLALGLACALGMTLAPATFAASLEERGSDLWKEAKVVTTYSLNEHLSDASIDIDVENGVAVLTGNVESEIDRRLAEELALGVDGISGVSNQLQVGADVKREAHRGEWRRAVADATLTARVKSRLLWNSQTDGLALDVTTRDGRVSLAGTVGSAEEAQLVEQIALNTEGVRAVSSKLVVASDDSGGSTSMLDKAAAKAGKAMDGAARTTGDAVEKTGRVISDSWITAKVKTSILLDRRFVNSEVDVTTKNQVVTLSGSVDTRQQLEELVQMVNHVKGVETVRAALDVSSS